MCGFAGYIGIAEHGRPSAAAMIRAIAHRGPDRVAEAVLPGAALAAARLRIIGGSDGDQPRICTHSRTVLALNGEIYNFKALAAELGFDTDADARVAHGALAEWGESAIRRFRGGFALAWMAADGRSVVLARDEFGQRPLFFAPLGGGVLFASEMAALFAAGASDAVDDDAVAEHLQLHFRRPGKTLFRDIRSVRPGEILRLEIDADGRIRRTASRFCYDGPFAEDVTEAFLDAVRLHGHRERPATIFLSGGQDSTAILGGLAAVGRPPERAVVGAYTDSPGFDERPFARAAAGSFGMPLDEVEIDARSFAAAIPETIAALEEPIAGPGAVSSFILARRIAAQSRVCFGGQGGDELFGGYERLRVFAHLLSKSPVDVNDAYRPLLSTMLSAHLAGPADHLAPYRAAIDRARGIEDVFTKDIDIGGARRRLAALFDDSLQPLESAAKFEVDCLLPGLLAVDDRVTARFGIESRAPLLDQALWKCVSRIPFADRSPATAPRALFFRALGGFLPDRIRSRTDKMGFPIPLASFWRGPLRRFAEETLLDGLSARGIVVADRVRRLLDGDGHGGRAVFALIALEHFFREHARRRTAPAANDAVAVIEIGTVR